MKGARWIERRERPTAHCPASWSGPAAAPALPPIAWPFPLSARRPDRSGPGNTAAAGYGCSGENTPKAENTHKFGRSATLNGRRGAGVSVRAGMAAHSLPGERVLAGGPGGSLGRYDDGMSQRRRPANTARAQFAALVQQPEEQWNLDRAALLIAQEAYPDLAVEQYLRRLDALAETTRGYLPHVAGHAMWSPRRRAAGRAGGACRA